jgi:antitoxin VapB
MLSKLFRSGNSQALRIPKELAFPADWNEVLIERQGDTLVVRPVRRRALTGIATKFAAFPVGFMAQGREPEAETERDGQ